MTYLLTHIACVLRMCPHLYPPTHNREPYDTLLCTVQHHVPIDPYAERMLRAVLTRSVIQSAV